MSRVRNGIAALALAGLLWPAAHVSRDIRWHLAEMRRLREQGRTSDRDYDTLYRSLLPHLPPAGRVGFSVASIANFAPADQERIRQFLQYSIVPRTLVRSTDTEFVIEKGPAAAPASLTHHPAFVVVAAPADDVRLLRRVSR